MTCSPIRKDYLPGDKPYSSALGQVTSSESVTVARDAECSTEQDSVRNKGLGITSLRDGEE